MLKRTTKMISLLIAATSMMTITPAMAVETSTANTVASTNSQQYVTKEVFDGTVNNAKAFDAGVFFVDGYKGADDDTAIYYVTDDGKFNKIDVDGVESGDILQDSLQGQYLEIVDSNGNATYLDEKNGYKVVDDDIRLTMVDNAANKLRAAMKKDDTGRFLSTCYDTSIKADVKNANNKFTTFLSGSPTAWSHYKYTLKDDFIKGKGYSTIYAGQDGSYVDGDYNLGKLKVALSTTGASVAINNTKDTYEITDNGQTYDLRAQISEDSSFINEQKDNIRRKADLTIYKKLKDDPDSAYVPATNEFYFGSDNNYRYKVTSGNSVKVIQSFSKQAATDTIDGIKYPNVSEIYFMIDEDGNQETITGSISSNSATKDYANYYVDGNNNLHARYLRLAKKNGYNYIDLGNYKETDINGPKASQSFNGIFYCLSGDYMKTWNGDGFDKAYKIDGSMNYLNVFDKNNVIVWSDNKGVFSIIHNNVPTTTTAAANATTALTVTKATTTQAQAGWAKNSDASWCYIKEDGSKAVGWFQSPINKSWYYMNNEGIMASNKWINSSEKWYFLKEDGSMATGWVQDSGKWYYLDQSGAMVSNVTIDGFDLGSDGAWIQ